MVLGVVAAIGLAAAVYFYLQNNYDKPQPTEPVVGEKALTDSATEKKSPTSTPSTPQEEKQTPNQNQPSGSPTFTVTVVRAGQISPGGEVQIRALIEGATTGTCSATFSGPGTAFSKTTSITTDGRTYSCGELDAAAAEFSAGGSWKYILKVTSGTVTSSPIEGQFTVTK